MSKPTQRLVEGALVKALDGDEKCKAILARWVVDYPDEVVAALGSAISVSLGYEPGAVTVG